MHLCKKIKIHKSEPIVEAGNLVDNGDPFRAYENRLLNTTVKSELPLLKNILKLFLNFLEKMFFISIFLEHKKVTYDLIKFKRKFGAKKLFSYNYSFDYDPNLTIPYQIKYLKDFIFLKYSILLNTKSADHSYNQFIALLTIYKIFNVC